MLVFNCWHIDIYHTNIDILYLKCSSSPLFCLQVGELLPLFLGSSSYENKTKSATMTCMMPMMIHSGPKASVNLVLLKPATTTAEIAAKIAVSIAASTSHIRIEKNSSGLFFENCITEYAAHADLPIILVVFLVNNLLVCVRLSCRFSMI